MQIANGNITDTQRTQIELSRAQGPDSVRAGVDIRLAARKLATAVLSRTGCRSGQGVMWSPGATRISAVSGGRGHRPHEHPGASPQTNGICERFHKTILEEFYRVTFRKKLYSTLDELQVDLDRWMSYLLQSGAHASGPLVLRQDTDAVLHRQLAHRKGETTRRVELTESRNLTLG